MRFKLPARAGWSRLRRGVAAAVTVVLGCAGLAALATTQASAAPACQVAYSVNQWNTGFTAAITITNNGSPITSWTLAYSYTGNQALTQGWSGNWTQSGANVTVTNASWNGSLATGGSTQIGANFSYSGTNTAPTAFTLNGVACNGAGPTPTPTATSPDPDAHLDVTDPDAHSDPHADPHGDRRHGRRLAAGEPADVHRGAGHQRSDRRAACPPRPPATSPWPWPPPVTPGRPSRPAPRSPSPRATGTTRSR